MNKKNMFQKYYFYNFINKFLDSNKIYRRLILILLDYFSLNFSYLISLVIFKDLDQSINYDSVDHIFKYVLILALPIYFLTKQYKPLTRFINNISFYAIIFRNIFVVFIPTSFFYINSFENKGLYFWFIFTLIVISFQIGHRLVIKDLIYIIFNKSINDDRKKVAIYKADYLGFQLCNLLQSNNNYKVMCFFDDSPSLKGSSINNIPIRLLSEFNPKENKLEELYIASDSVPQNKLISINKIFKSEGVKIVRLSPLKDIDKKKQSDELFSNFSSNDYLCRDRVTPSEELIRASINNDISVSVTGAGGSIGSELCRQILNLKPKTLILIDFCEYNLFKINEELKDFNISETNIIAKLLNSENELALEKCFKENTVNLVFHAAAYKHVSLVEINPIEGLKNNLQATKSVCNAAANSNVDKVILISSDKAVKPNNVMGGSKLLSEFIFKEFANKKEINTFFSIVRFGNVLDSSGSVIPIFREQIKNGGPITITHPDMERFLMTISEAVQLVLQASVITKGGETFILNMGKPVKILEIAKKMIISSGLEIKDKNNKTGDIEIKEIGIRKGEKLKEELFVNGVIQETIHPLINKAKENLEIPKDIVLKIEEILLLIKDDNEGDALELFYNLLHDYKYQKINSDY